MERTRFEQIIDAYGANPERWPAAERNEGELSLNFAASAALAEARQLDAILDADPVPLAATDLRERVALAMQTQPVRMLRASSRPRWAMVAGLAAACVCGISIGMLFGRDLAARQYEATALAVIEGDDVAGWNLPAP